MQINIINNNQYNNNKNFSFKGEIIKNSSYKKLRKFSKSLPNLTKTFENIENTIKKYPDNYTLEINIYDDRRPSTTDYGALKTGRFDWIPTTVLKIKSDWTSFRTMFDGDDNYYLSIDTLKNLTNPFSELSQKIFPNITNEDNSICNINNQESKMFKTFKNEVINKKTGKIDERVFHSIEYFIERFIRCDKATPVEIFDFLTKLSEDKILSIEMARQFSQNPRGANNLKHKLIEYLGGGEEGEDLFNSWYYDEKNGYRRAYKHFYNEEIWDKANNLMDLIKQSPNLSTWALRCFCKEKNVEPILGSLPENFGNRDDFMSLIKELKAWRKDTIKLKDKTKSDDTIFEKPFNLTVNGSEYNIKQLTRGHSPKLKFMLTDVNNPEKSYVIKFAPYDAIGNTDRSNKFRDNQAIHPDMPYVDSMVDFYLKLNNCPNAADILYFDYKAQASLYNATKGEYPDFSKEFERNIYKFRNYKPIADIYKLGVELNDIYHTNFITDENGVCKAIDTGHAKYNNIFRPLVSEKHIALANLCGREL